MLLNRHAVDYARKAYAEGRGAELDRLTKMRVDVAPGRAPIFPRTFGQAVFLETVRKSELTIGLGPAGTGKTWLAMAMAVSALLKNEVSRIILTRPAVEAGEALGFLPGDLQQKILPYLRPLYDALNEMMPAEEVPGLIERGVIEVAPLAYMRGRTLNRAFIILDEAQNTTREQMLMFLTRLGFGSKAVVNGDLTQVDLPAHKMPGLLEAEFLLREVPGVGVVRLTAADVVRHPLVQRIIEAYKGREKGVGNGGAGPDGGSLPEKVKNGWSGRLGCAPAGRRGWSIAGNALLLLGLWLAGVVFINLGGRSAMPGWRKASARPPRWWPPWISIA
jgi:phosphate starvation-inducible protein PhoH and related proteins